MPGPTVRKRPPLAPVKASMDRLISLEACLRPFRPQGPRIEAERMGRKTIVHNYGHGGSGWSLSWGCRPARRRVGKGDRGKESGGHRMRRHRPHHRRGRPARRSQGAYLHQGTDALRSIVSRHRRVVAQRQDL